MAKLSTYIIRLNLFVNSDGVDLSRVRIEVREPLIGAYLSLVGRSQMASSIQVTISQLAYIHRHLHHLLAVGGQSRLRKVRFEIGTHRVMSRQSVYIHTVCIVLDLHFVEGFVLLHLSANQRLKDISIESLGLFLVY